MRSSLLVSVAVISASCVSNAQTPPVLVDYHSSLESPAIPEEGQDSGDIGVIDNSLPRIEPEISSDVANYFASVTTEPQYLSVDSVLATIIPSSVQEQYSSDPSGFYEALVTATQTPAWATASDIETYLVSLDEDIASIVEEDLDNAQPSHLRIKFAYPTSGFAITRATGTEGYPRPTGAGRVKPTGFVTGFYANAPGTATGTGTGVIPAATSGINSTVPTLGQASPTPIASANGGASVMMQRTGSAAAAAVAFIGAACWLLV